MNVIDPHLTHRRFVHQAMATDFEIVLADRDADEAMHISEAVFAEIDRMEQLLSFFIPWSDVAQVNRLEPGLTMAVSAEAFSCIAMARQISVQTAGAFDLTAGALLVDRQPWDMDTAKPVGGAAVQMKPDPRPDFRAVHLDHASMHVGRTAAGVAIDLGGIGKGFALDQAKLVLEDWGVESALIHAGQSTILPIGIPAQGQAWPMRLLDPRNESDVLGHFDLCNASVSASSTLAAPHILDPETGVAAASWLGAWAIAPSSAAADALSTAFMVMTLDQIKRFCLDYPEVRGLVIGLDGSRPGVFCCGDWGRFPLLLS